MSPGLRKLNRTARLPALSTPPALRGCLCLPAVPTDTIAAGLTPSMSVLGSAGWSPGRNPTPVSQAPGAFITCPFPSRGSSPGEMPKNPPQLTQHRTWAREMTRLAKPCFSVLQTKYFGEEGLAAGRGSQGCVSFAPPLMPVWILNCKRFWKFPEDTMPANRKAPRGPVCAVLSWSSPGPLLVAVGRAPSPAASIQHGTRHPGPPVSGW